VLMELQSVSYTYQPGTVFAKSALHDISLQIQEKRIPGDNRTGRIRQVHTAAGNGRFNKNPIKARCSTAASLCPAKVFIPTWGWFSSILSSRCLS